MPTYDCTPQVNTRFRTLTMPIGEAWTAEEVAEYLSKWKVEEAVQAAINSAIRSRASDPLMHVADFLEARGRAAEQQQEATAAGDSSSR